MRRSITCILFLACTACVELTFAQGTSLEDSIDQLFGVERLEALNRLTAQYLQTDSRRALRSAREAVDLADNLFRPASLEVDDSHVPLRVVAHHQLGTVYFRRDRFVEAGEELRMAEQLAGTLPDRSGVPDSRPTLAALDSLALEGEVREGFFRRHLGDLGVGEKFSDATTDMSIAIAIRAGESDAEQGDVEGAIQHYETAINKLRNLGQSERILELEMRIVDLLEQGDEPDQAARRIEELVDTLMQELTLVPVPAESVSSLTDGGRQQLQERQDEFRRKSESAATEADYQKSLSYFKLYTALNQRMREDSIQVAAQRERREREILLLRQEKQIAELEVENAAAEHLRQVRLRNTLVTGTVIGALLTLAIAVLYLGKRKQHAQLGVAFRDLHQTTNKLQQAESHIRKLLRQQLSDDVARALLSDTSDQPT